jgi:hypothetical protein
MGWQASLMQPSYGMKSWQGRQLLEMVVRSFSVLSWPSDVLEVDLVPCWASSSSLQARLQLGFQLVLWLSSVAELQTELEPPLYLSFLGSV